MERQQVGDNERLGYSEENYKKYLKYAWITLLAFSAMYLFTYNGRLNMGLALPHMFKEFGWTKAEAGLLTSLLFWAYGIGQLINGRLCEIVGPKQFAFLGVILSITTNIVISFQSSFLVIAILWTLNGYFQAMVFAPGLTLVSRWWPHKRRGMATGIVSASLTIAQLVCWLTVLASLNIMPDWGWRAAFRLPVLLTAVFAILFWILAKRDQADIGLPSYVEIPEMKAAEEEYATIIREKGKLYPYITMFKHWTFVVWCLIMVLLNAARYAMFTWVPTYFVEVYKVNLKQGVLFTLVLPLGMVLGAFLFPYLSDKFFPRNRAIGICAGTFVAAIIALIIPPIGSVTHAQYALFFLGFFPSVAALIWAYATDVGTRAFTGTAVGVLDFFGYVGAALQAVILGGILHATKNWSLVFYALAILFVSVTILAAIASMGAAAAGKKRQYA
jgi:sugar phosphate permease